MLSIGNLLGGMAFSPFAPWLVVAAAASAATFFVAKAGRDAMDAALAAPQGGNAAGGDKHTAAVAPEILWSYGKAYLSYFADQASAATAWDSAVLDLYRRFILPVDIVFAVSLAAFAVLFWLAVAGVSAAVSCAQPWLPWFAIFAASMGAVYGVADVAEDLCLIALLRDPADIGTAQAAIANLLTRVKFVTVFLSLIGVAVFGLLSAIDKVTPGLFGLFTRLAPQLLWRPMQGRGGGNASR